ncbi:MAG: response regulator [Candidatus Hydrogenedentota bacterium]
MPNKNPRRRGIERRILTSILWVGIVPMALALIGGYAALRATQRAEVMDDLTAAADKTAQGLHFANAARLQGVARLANEARIVDLLQSLEEGPSDLEPSARDREAVLEWMRHMVDITLEPADALTLYGPQGQLLLTTSAEEEGPPPSPSIEPIDEADYVDFHFPPESSRYEVELAAPVKHLETGAVLGYIAEVASVTDTLHYLYGGGAGMPERGWRYKYQVIVGEAEEPTVLRPTGQESPYPYEARPAAPSLLEVIQEGEGRGSVRRIRDFETSSDTRIDAFVACTPLYGVPDGYLVVYRPASAVFGALDRGVAIASAGAALLVALLCLQAYRNVHNNVVRPVSLLNEGAQIIGQGDLELKLKIDTGDEIEGLANSFNKMALALKRNIRRLEESEAKYRSVVNSMRDGILQTDHNQVITFLNPAGVKIWGLDSAEEALGQSLEEFFLVGNDLARLNKELQAQGYIERVRVWMKRKDTRAICVELSANCMPDENGGCAALEIIFRNVTKAIRLEQEARERAERLSAINQIANVINSSLEAGRLYENLVVEVKKLVDFDYAALALLNAEENAFEVRVLWPPQGDNMAMSCPLNAEECCSAWVNEHNQSFLVEDLAEEEQSYYKYFPPDIRSCASVPLYASDRIIGTLNVGAEEVGAYSKYDIAVLEQLSPHIAAAIRNAQLLENLQASLEEVTKAREKLYEVNEELKSLDEMKTNLLSNVSHELRTPLVSVMGYTDMILNEKVGPVNDMQRDYLTISLRNIDKLVTLIENLLDFSRLHRGTEEMSFDAFDLVDCVQSSVDIVKPLADGRDIHLHLNAPEEGVIVEGDKGKLGQVFNNLLSNAIKFNRPNGSVTMEITPSEESVTVAVSDTGIGIPQDSLDKIFTRFYQYDSSSTRKYGGTGIGLSIAQDIVRLHGSRIHVSSVEGEGTTFRFSLPLMTPRSDDYSQRTGVPMPTETEALVQLVSQDRALTTQMRNLLEPEGIEIISAASSATVGLTVEKYRPDCVIVDAESKETGSAILDYILAEFSPVDLPIVLLTNDDALYEAYRRQVATRVKRGFRKSTLLSGIRHALNQNKTAGTDFGQGILCVDDDPEILEFIQRCLEPEGYTVDTCESGEDAVEKARSGQYSVVLLDIAMPGLNGWETCRRMREDPSLAGLKIYMVTAKPIDHIVTRPDEAGMDGYLLKPFRSDDLVEIVRGLEPLHIPNET